MDEKICDNIIDNSAQKIEINNCQSMILQKKAINNLDTKICDKISEDVNKKFCLDIVKNEKLIKLEEEKINKFFNFKCTKYCIKIKSYIIN